MFASLPIAASLLFSVWAFIVHEPGHIITHMHQGQVMVSLQWGPAKLPKHRISGTTHHQPLSVLRYESDASEGASAFSG